jgi:nitroreductase
MLSPPVNRPCPRHGFLRCSVNLAVCRADNAVHSRPEYVAGPLSAEPTVSLLAGSPRLLRCGTDRTPVDRFPRLRAHFAKMGPQGRQRQSASIYPAVQNIILACRAFGLGTLITTNHIRCKDEIKALLGSRPDVSTYALSRSAIRRGNSGRSHASR